MKRTLSLCLALFVCLNQLSAQAGAGSGSVGGIVQEGSTEDGLPQTTVTLTNAGLGLKRVMTTTDDGLFTAPALMPSAGYRIKVAHKGFADWDSNEFEVHVGESLNFEIALQRATENPTPAGTTTPPPRIREVTAGTANLSTGTQVEGLPSKQRRVDSLVATSPVITMDDRTGKLVITGQAFSNIFLADGIATTNSYYQERANLAPQLPLDEIRELQVHTADYPAEFGGA